MSGHYNATHNGMCHLGYETDSGQENFTITCGAAGVFVPNVSCNSESNFENMLSPDRELCGN